MDAGERTEGVFLQGLKTKLLLGGRDVAVDLWEAFITSKDPWEVAHKAEHVQSGLSSGATKFTK